jgi:hypothetical protein
MSKHLKRNLAISRKVSKPARYMRGQSMVEYFIVTAFTVIVLIQGAESSAVQSVVTAMKEAYAGFTYALSYATNLVGF